VNKEKVFKKIILPFVGGISIIISLSVLIGWGINYKPILSIIPGSSTMKVNTAIVFLFGGINLLLLNNKNTSIPFNLLSVIIGFIGVFTLYEYFFNSKLSIDNLLIFDKFSTENSGRMSPATAFNAILLSIIFLSNKTKNEIFEKIGLLVAKFSLVISFTAIVAFLFSIPTENRTTFYKTMAIHTSILYFAQTLVLILNHRKSVLSKLLFSNYSGSLIFKKLLPIILLAPLVFCYLIIFAINEKTINVEFGIITFIVINIPLTIIIIGSVSYNLNKVNKEEIELNNSLIKTNNHLSLFKEALDKVAIISISDQNGIIKYINDEYLSISGFSRKELIGNTNRLINSEHHEPKFLSQLWNTINEGKIWKGKIKSKNKNGDFIYLDCTIVPLKDEDDNFTEFFSIMYNITERIESEKLRLKYIKTIESKNKELEQYTYITSHDLQEPLNTIIGYINIFNEKYENKFDEIDKKILRYIVEASLRMRLLIKNVLDYGRIGQNSKTEEIDCNIIIENIKKDFESKIKINNAKILYKNLPTIIGVKSNIYLLFQNLISNALKFTKKNTNTEISISFLENEDFWTFKVKDNGIGIEEKYLSSIFKIFKRLHNQNTYEGTGIGLAHCKKIIDIHDGKIWVESSINNGSSFYFTISKKIKIG